MQKSSEVIDDKLSAQPLSRRPRLDLIGQRLALTGAVIGIWWLSSLSVPHYILPGPARVWDALQLIIANGDLWNNLGITLWRVAVGFVVAALVGLPFGILLGASKRAGEFFEPVIPVLNTVSSAISAIFTIIWFGISNATTIFVVFMTAMPLIITNVWQGTRTVNADFIELAQVLRMPYRKVMTKSICRRSSPTFFPARALPSVSAGACRWSPKRSALRAADLIRSDQVFAWTLTMVIMMATIEIGLMKPLENYLFRWRKGVAEP